MVELRGHINKITLYISEFSLQYERQNRIKRKGGDEGRGIFGNLLGLVFL